MFSLIEFSRTLQLLLLGSGVGNGGVDTVFIIIFVVIVVALAAAEVVTDVATAIAATDIQMFCRFFISCEDFEKQQKRRCNSIK